MDRKQYENMEYRNYRLQKDFPVFFLSGEQWRISDVPSSRLHFHNCVEIGVCHTCGGTLRVYDSCFPFQAGDITCIPQNVPHTTWSERGTKSQWSYLFFDPESLFREVPALVPPFSHLAGNGGGRFVFSEGQAPELYPLMQEILRELEEEKPDFRLSVRGLLASLLVKMRRLQSPSTQGDTEGPEEGNREFSVQHMPSILPALDFVEENYSEQFDINALAKACCLSETHFRRLFHQVMHTAPLAYVNGVRIEKACGLLCLSEEPILSVAEKVGFPSISSFNRQFMRIMQITPSEYRRCQRLQGGTGRNRLPVISEFTGWLLPEENPE